MPFSSASLMAGAGCDVGTERDRLDALHALGDDGQPGRHPGQADRARRRRSLCSCGIPQDGGANAGLDGGEVVRRTGELLRTII